MFQLRNLIVVYLGRCYHEMNTLCRGGCSCMRMGWRRGWCGRFVGWVGRYGSLGRRCLCGGSRCLCCGSSVKILFKFCHAFIIIWASDTASPSRASAPTVEKACMMCRSHRFRTILVGWG